VKFFSIGKFYPVTALIFGLASVTFCGYLPPRLFDRAGTIRSLMLSRAVIPYHLKLPHSVPFGKFFPVIPFPVSYQVAPMP